MSIELKQEAQRALEALEEIALAGMSGTGQESEEGMRDWHARQAWKFIGIAARALDPLRTAIQQAEGEPVAHLWQHAETGRTRIVMSGDVWTANDRWCYVGTLVLGSTHPAPGVPDDVVRDAQRYRWLRTNKQSEEGSGCKFNLKKFGALSFTWAKYVWNNGKPVLACELDAAIDAAMQKGGE